MVWLTASPANGNPPHTVVRSQPQHIDALDGIRGIAILMVCIFYFTRGIAGGVADQILYSGLYGVDLFFTLSGFFDHGHFAG
jgi:peptidoglycan/LPS O-acetylase OafA/YrhL